MKSIFKVILIILNVLFSSKVEANMFFPHLSEDCSFIHEKKWQSLYENINDTVNWISNRKIPFPNDGWLINNDELVLLSGRKGGDIRTKKKYSNFELKLEFKMTRLVNSGVKYFVNQMKNNDTGKEEWIGFEYQIIDDFNWQEIHGFDDDKGSTAALYLLYAPNKSKKLNPSGVWNSMKISVYGNHIEHWLNGKKVLSVDVGSKEFQDLIQKTKFNVYDDYGKKKEGYILIQDHGSQIHFRNIMIREL